jgi:hypothetical protein
MMNRLLAPPETVGLLPYGAAVVPVRAGEWPRQLTLDGSPVRLPDAAEQAEAARFFAKGGRRSAPRRLPALDRRDRRRRLRPLPRRPRADFPDGAGAPLGP